MKDKKIITCAPLPPPNGGITNWYNIVRNEAQNRGIEFLNVNTSHGNSQNNRSIFYRVFVQGFQMLKCGRVLKRIIKENRDVSVAHIATSGSLGLIRDILLMKILKRNGIKAVYHIHFGRIPEIFEIKGFEYKLLMKAFMLSDAIIVIDPLSYKTLNLNLKDKKIEYLPNPVVPVGNEKSFVSKNEIIYLGMVYKEKGIEELLSAWSELTGKYPQWKLNIVGKCDDEYEKYLLDNFSTKNVEFYGYQEHKTAIKILSECDFLVLPSYTEGFPNVIIEAMMCEKAVVATDVGAIADILSGDCGIVIKSKDVSSLRDSMERLMSDKSLRSSLGANGKKKAMSNYASSIVFERYRAIWDLFV